MSYNRPPARLLSLLVLSLVTIVSVAKPATAVDRKTTQKRPPISIFQLKGPWVATLTGDTGCGIATAYLTFTLNSKGSGTAKGKWHSSTCGDSQANNPITITSLNANGSGTANLSCGTGCGWDFSIQVNRAVTLFNMVDVSNADNYLEGTAIRQ